MSWQEWQPGPYFSKYLNLFKNLNCKFEGLNQDVEEGFTKIIQVCLMYIRPYFILIF